ncbi:hypothetical protein F4776DRAFT_639453, partial [Hypoxylon sp. NC0597]
MIGSPYPSGYDQSSTSQTNQEAGAYQVAQAPDGSSVSPLTGQTNDYGFDLSLNGQGNQHDFDQAMIGSPYPSGFNQYSTSQTNQDAQAYQVAQAPDGSSVPPLTSQTYGHGSDLFLNGQGNQHDFDQAVNDSGYHYGSNQSLSNQFHISFDQPSTSQADQNAQAYQDAQAHDGDLVSPSTRQADQHGVNQFFIDPLLHSSIPPPVADHTPLVVPPTLHGPAASDGSAVSYGSAAFAGPAGHITPPAPATAPTTESRRPVKLKFVSHWDSQYPDQFNREYMSAAFNRADSRQYVEIVRNTPEGPTKRDVVKAEANRERSKNPVFCDALTDYFCNYLRQMNANRTVAHAQAIEARLADRFVWFSPKFWEDVNNYRGEGFLTKPPRGTKYLNHFNWFVYQRDPRPEPS